MPDTEQLGTEDMPFDPQDPLHEGIANAEAAKKKADDAEANANITLADVFSALRELTVQIGTLAKEQKEMRERHDKWIKAGKF